MSTPKKILLAYDFSQGSHVATEEAFALAKLFGAQLIITHIVDTEITDVYKHILAHEMTAEIEKGIRQALGKISAKMPSHDVIVKHGRPHVVISQIVKETGADLVLMGSHGHGAISHILLGSTCESLIRQCPVPVLICRKKFTDSLKKILVPIDLLASWEPALENAKTLAQSFAAEIQLMHVVEIIPHASYGEFSEIITIQLEKQNKVLRKISEKNGLATEPVVLEGKIAHSIVHYCKENPDIGLVVMTSHGRRGLEHILLGSVAESLTRYIPTNIMVIPFR